MKEFNNIITDLPYKESEGYVDALVGRCKAEALAKAEPGKHATATWRYGLAGLAAAAAVTLGVLLWQNNAGDSSPIDRFLASLSDDEAEMIVDFPIDDIPESYQ